MSVMVIHGGRALRGSTGVPGDKSVSHRAVMLGALAEGTTEVDGFLPGADCLSTVACFRSLGAQIERPAPERLVIQGVGPAGLREPDDVLDVGNSGTTLYLTLGILAGQPFYSVLTGDASIRRRPVRRVGVPLREMGAIIRARCADTLPPVTLIGGNLRPVTYTMPTPSAQVKSSVLLAGLFAEGITTATADAATRDHTERMLRAFGAEVGRTAPPAPPNPGGASALSIADCRLPIADCPPDPPNTGGTRMPASPNTGGTRMPASPNTGGTRMPAPPNTGGTGSPHVWGDGGADPTSAWVRGPAALRGREVRVPGDISSAAFLLVAATIVPGSEVLITGVGMNPTRSGIVDALQAMGASISVEDARDATGEPVADLRVRSSGLRGTRVAGAMIPRLIDEIPVLAIAAACAGGDTEIRDAGALRIKETDRIATTIELVRAFGASAEPLPDGLVVHGLGDPAALRGATVDSGGDHRIAMAGAVAGLAAAGSTTIHGAECVEVSFPGFAQRLAALGAGIEGQH